MAQGTLLVTAYLQLGVNSRLVNVTEAGHPIKVLKVRIQVVQN